MSFMILYGLGNRMLQSGCHLHFLTEGGDAMFTYEALSLMILFSMLVIAILTFGIKK